MTYDFDYMWWLCLNHSKQHVPTEKRVSVIQSGNLKEGVRPKHRVYLLVRVFVREAQPYYLRLRALVSDRRFSGRKKTIFEPQIAV